MAYRLSRILKSLMRKADFTREFDAAFSQVEDQIDPLVITSGLITVDTRYFPDGATKYVKNVGSFQYDAASTATVDNLNVFATNTGIGRWIRASSFSGNNTLLANLAALAAIDDAPLSNRTSFIIETLEDEFYLDKTSVIIADGITIINSLSSASGVNPGRWIRRPLFSIRFLSQRTWFVDPQGLLGGNDENSGATNLLPLRTFKEFNRRVWAHLGFVSGTTGRYLVNIMSDTNLGDPPRFLGGFKSSVSPVHKSTVSTDIVFKGFYITALTGGVVAASTFINAATNDIVTITDATTSWSTYINGNYAIRFTSGTLNGCFAFPVKDLGSGQVAITLPYLNDINLTASTVVIASATVTPGTTYEIVQMAICPEVDLSQRDSNSLPNVSYQYLNFTGEDNPSLPTVLIRQGYSTTAFYQCVVSTNLSYQSPGGGFFIMQGCLHRGTPAFPSQSIGVGSRSRIGGFASGFIFTGLVLLSQETFIQFNRCVIMCKFETNGGSSGTPSTIELVIANTLLGSGGIFINCNNVNILTYSNYTCVGSGYSTYVNFARGGIYSANLADLTSSRLSCTFTGPLFTFDGLGYALPPSPLAVPALQVLTAVPSGTSLNSINAAPWQRAAVPGQSTAKVLLYGADGISSVAFTG